MLQEVVYKVPRFLNPPIHFFISDIHPAADFGRNFFGTNFIDTSNFIYTIRWSKSELDTIWL